MAFAPLPHHPHHDINRSQQLLRKKNPSEAKPSNSRPPLPPWLRHCLTSYLAILLIAKKFHSLCKIVSQQQQNNLSICFSVFRQRFRHSQRFLWTGGREGKFVKIVNSMRFARKSDKYIVIYFERGFFKTVKRNNFLYPRLLDKVNSHLSQFVFPFHSAFVTDTGLFQLPQTK